MNAHPPLLTNFRLENSYEGVVSFVYGLFMLAQHGVLLASLSLPPGAAVSTHQLLELGGVALAPLGSLIALTLGLLGLQRADCKRTLAAWGVGLNLVFLFGLVALAFLALSGG